MGTLSAERWDVGDPSDTGGPFLTRTSATNFTLDSARPLTDLDDVRQGVRDFQSQVIAWSRELNERGVAQPRSKIDQGHDRLYSGLGASYLVCRDTGISINNRKSFITLMRFGAADITKVDDFYTEDTGTFGPVPARGTTAGDWYAWVDVSANPVARVNLVDSVAVNGAIAADVNLLGDWASTITA